MKYWTATDSGKVEEIKNALLQLEKEYGISYSEEMKWLDNLKYRVLIEKGLVLESPKGMYKKE